MLQKSDILTWQRHGLLRALEHPLARIDGISLADGLQNWLNQPAMRQMRISRSLLESPPLKKLILDFFLDIFYWFCGPICSADVILILDFLPCRKIQSGWSNVGSKNHLLKCLMLDRKHEQ